MADPVLPLRLAAESVTGRREANEDAILAETLPDGRILLAVADGMGGHAAGEVASRVALESLRTCLLEGKGLEESLAVANREVFRRAQEPGKQGMGTTLAVALVEGTSFRLANVGDSRVYLLRKEGIRQLTEDHSFLAEALKRGHSHEEASRSRWKDALTRSVGTTDSVKADFFGPFAVAPPMALILCSDGLYKALPTPDLAGIYLRAGGPRGGVQALVAEAFERGSDDNISAVVAEWGELPRALSGGTMPMEYQPPAEEARPAQGGPPDEPPPEAGHGRRWWHWWKRP